jgi:apolipoprotein N-acyltransferase
MEKIKPYAFLLLAGILYALGYPSLIAESLIVTPMIGVGILFYYLLQDNSLKIKVLYLLCFNLAFNLTGFYWIANTLMEFGALPYPLAVLLNALFSLIITPHYWVALFIIHFFRSDIKTLQKMDFGLFGFVLAMFLTLCEYLVPQQFNVFLGQPIIALSKYLGFAHIAGLPIYSFFSYLLVFEFINLFKFKRINFFNYATIFLFIIMNPFFVPKKNVEDRIETNVRIVQANISNFLKVDSEKGTYASVGQVISRYSTLSTIPSPFSRAMDIIIWPETAYPFSLKTNLENISDTSVPIVISQIAVKQNSNLFIGGYDSQRKNGDSSYFKTESNTAFHISDSGELIDLYNKQVLIPFGETLPFGPLNKYLSSYIENISFFKEGEKFTLFSLENGSKFISTICYELLKPEFIRDYLNSLKVRPHFMINLTNDSWYGKTMEPEQHIFLAKWRALEFNLPIIRSTNTGISSIIYPDGTESRRLGVFETGNLDIKTSFGVNDRTLFQRFGLFMIFPLWFLYFIFHLLRIRLRND